MDMNGDGFIGGQGKSFLPSFWYILTLSYDFRFSGIEGRLKTATHIYFNGNSMIGRLPDTILGGGGAFHPTGYDGPGFY